MDRIKNYVKPGDYIADLGCSEEPRWYAKIPASCRIDGFDIRRIEVRRPNTAFYKANIELLYKEHDFKDKYDFVVANHIFEHVRNPYRLAKSMAQILKLNGLAHIAVPDASDFADRFYRLIFRGGGHIQKFTRNDLPRLMAEYGFELMDQWRWEEDYGWLENASGKLPSFGLGMMGADEIQYIAKVLKTELTKDKGYWYGWGMIFKKKEQVEILTEYSYSVPEIVKLYPTEARFQESFLLQPNGLSALVVQGKNLTYGICICFDGIELETDYDGDVTLTACVPGNLLTCGMHMVCLSYLSKMITPDKIFMVLSMAEAQ